jgi:hypothetical protein
MAMKSSLSRRDFLKISSFSILASLSACREMAMAAEIPTNTATPSPTIIPSLAATTVQCSPDDEFYNRHLTLNGERYSAQVPDTFDFQKHAELSLNALTRCTKPDADYSVYFYGKVNRNPPILTDVDTVPNPTSFNGKFSEATLMMRQISGSDLNQQVDQTWRAKFLRWLVQANPSLTGPDLGRLFAWLALIYRIEGDECYRQLGEKVTQQMLNQSRLQGDYRYFPGGNGAEPTGWDAVAHGWTLQGIARFYEVTGYSPAESLGKGIARFLRDRSGLFDADGHFLYRHQREFGEILHFHHNGNALLSIAELAAITDDQELAEFARQGYEYARGTGSPLVGFFPEYIPDYPGQFPYIDCETCCVADMVLLALHLTKAGQSDYWDDVDRYIRNQLAENHMLYGAWINDYVASMPISPVPEGATGDNVSERVIGSFSGWASANQYLVDMNQPLISACCTGNGSRALFYVWQDMLNFDRERLTIHLLFNRASRWADVNSFIPYEGRVEVLMKAECELELRLPEWVSPEETNAMVNQTPVEPSFAGRYARLGRLQRGDIAILTFPIIERTVDTQIGDQSYSLVIKGNEVVSIRPLGNWCPYYQREYYRQNTTPMIERKRYVVRIDKFN